jgi:hypothetical protein
MATAFLPTLAASFRIRGDGFGLTLKSLTCLAALSTRSALARIHGGGKPGQGFAKTGPGVSGDGIAIFRDAREFGGLHSPVSFKALGTH